MQGVSFNVHEGEILALLGRNGAGKTSTLRAIARLELAAAAHGEVWLDHQPLHNMAAYQASQAGVGLVPEDRRIISGLTVEENLLLAQIAPPVGWSLERIYDLFPRLGERRKQEGTTLVRRRTADAGHRPRVGPRHQAACCWMNPMKVWHPSSWTRSRRR